MRQAIRERNPKRFLRRLKDGLWHGRWYIAILVVAVAGLARAEDASNRAHDASAENATLIKVVAKQQKQLDSQTDAVIQGLVESCEKNGNPLRKAVRKLIQKGISNVNDPKIKEILPDVPADVIERLIHQGNQEAKAELDEIQNVSCQSQYR